MKYLKQVAYIFLLIGGLNWGIYGVSGYNVVDVIFGSVPMISGIIYVLVGLSALYIILNRYILCADCYCRLDSCCSKTEECPTCKIEEKPEVSKEV